MAKFCTECGKEIAQGVAFCTECGTKAPADPATATTETVTEAKDTKVEPPVVHTPPAQSYQAQQTYTQPAPDPTSKVVGTGAYFGLMLLFAIPIIGQIACLIMAFAPKNKNIKHFARAQLIWMVIAIVLIGILVALLSVLTNTLMDFIKESIGGEFSNLGDIFSNLGDLEGLTEQFQNGDLEGLTEQFQNGDLEGLTEQFQNGGLEGLPIE